MATALIMKIKGFTKGIVIGITITIITKAIKIVVIIVTVIKATAILVVITEQNFPKTAFFIYSRSYQFQLKSIIPNLYFHFLPTNTIESYFSSNN